MQALLPTCKKIAGHLGQTSRSLLLLAALGLPGLSQAQTVTFPRRAPFDGTSTSDFTLGGNAFLTTTGDAATNGTVSGQPIDGNGRPGVLRLTNATSDPQQAGYAIDNNTFATPNGFSISFEFFSYGTNSDVPADGFTVFLVDGEGTTPGNGFAIGGFGGSLGYAQRKVNGSTTTEPGVTKGYLGIGIDEYGNFGIASEGKSGGYQSQTALLPNAVTLRGPYNSADPSRATGYAYLAGSGSLPFNLAVGTSKTSQGSRITTPTDPGYRKAYINVIPVTTNGVTSYKITVRIQNGQNVATAVNNFTVVDPPSTLRVGFAASTGGSNGIHEIRGLEIVKAPIAVDDNAQTRYDRSVIINTLANDLNGGGAEINPATVDLNPGTVGRDASYTVTDKGTFSVDNQGVVTFTPTGTFSGTVSIPYTVLNLNDNLSNPGTITVVVTGADVQTVVSGPTPVNPGTTAAYAVATTNNGQEDAINVTPTLTLPAGATYVSGGTLSGNTVSFPALTLTGGQMVSNSVVISWPTAGSYTLTSNYTYPSGAAVPDAVAANNSSTLTVLVQGAANIGAVCAVPGKDGPGTLDNKATPNTYYPGVAAAQGSASIRVGTTPTGSSTPIAKGDLLLLMQMQGATMSTANDETYGTVSAATAGTYEYAVAAGPVDGSGNLPLAAALTNGYATVSATNASTPFQQFQVIRVPQYSILTVNGTVQGTAWNGSTGGVLALEVAGQASFTNGTLNMDGRGFRGGAGIQNKSTGTVNTYVDGGSGDKNYASKGEGIGGAPENVFDGSPTFVKGGTRTYQSYALGSYARGKAATGGGGGTYAATNAQYGGGGGANGGAGGTAAVPSGANNVEGGGDGGAIISPGATRLYLGGGGGAGVSTAGNPADALRSSGGLGGGIIMLRASSVAGSATISANGQTGNTGGTLNTNAGGGGGAGGTVALQAGSGLANLTATANGSNGTVTTGTNSSNGGGGGGGMIFSTNSLKSATALAGTNGTGATGGMQNANLASGTNCQPALTVSLRTTTPTITRAASMKATYVYTVSNTGGGITGLTATPRLAFVNGTNNLFKYASTTSAVVQLPNGTTQTLVDGTDYTVAGPGTSTPTFALTPGYVVPAGASVAFTFVADVATAAAANTPYGSNAASNYLDPQRAAATATTTAPAYISTGSSPDVVTIAAPLPVKLTRFAAVAVGADAVLTWATASEENNHHFGVERSLDGRAFEQIATVAGHGTTFASSAYTLTDAGASAHTTGVLYYRLRQVDYDGQASYSPVQVVRFRHAAGGVALYPNPATTSATLDLSSLPNGDYLVQVFETTGRLVQRGTYQSGKQTLLLEGLAAGTYFVKVQGTSLNLVLPFAKQ